MPEPLKIHIVIPARYASSRFPGKPLVKIAGKAMIERVYEQASLSRLATSVLVATDDERIFSFVRAFGGEVIMTADTHSTGTDRLAEVAEKCPDTDLIVNVQGDEPMISPISIDAAIEPLLDDSALDMSTIAYPLNQADEIKSPQIVKVVVDKQGCALYFSRYPIPYDRDCENEPNAPSTGRLGHAGLYVYRRDCLLRLASLEPTPLELSEKLEQLRALENGIRIKVVQVEKRSPGVDTPEDIGKVEALLNELNVIGT